MVSKARLAVPAEMVDKLVETALPMAQTLHRLAVITVAALEQETGAVAPEEVLVMSK
jgi:hypothetical protein